MVYIPITIRKEPGIVSDKESKVFLSQGEAAG
jgi:hypothetical protein